MSPRTLHSQQACDLVAAFLDQEWPTTDSQAITVERLHGGLINTLHIVTRSTPAIHEPATVVIRHFGLSGGLFQPAATSLTLSAAQQAVVYQEMGRRGWGPQIYGFFHGGRVEEFIPSHTLTASEACQPSVARNVARSYARLHSLRLPLRRDSARLVIEELSAAVRDKRDGTLATLRSISDARAQAYATIFASTNWAAELQWLASLSQEHDCKQTLTHGDANYLNILVRDGPLIRESGRQTGEPRTVLIDYETVAFGYRGVDIGGHFNERQYRYDQPDTQLTGYAVPNRHQQRTFCEAYLQEIRDLGEELTAVDTVEHLLLEADIGRMYQIVLTNLMCTVFDEVEEDPLFLSGLTHMMESYQQLKAAFARSHAG